jgi:hypothetical protein
MQSATEKQVRNPKCNQRRKNKFETKNAISDGKTSSKPKMQSATETWKARQGWPGFPYAIRIFQFARLRSSIF